MLVLINFKLIKILYNNAFDHSMRKRWSPETIEN